MFAYWVQGDSPCRGVQGTSSPLLRRAVPTPHSQRKGMHYENVCLREAKGAAQSPAPVGRAHTPFAKEKFA